MSKKEKLSELQKIRAKRNQDIVLNSYNFKISLKKNASIIGLSVKTIKKYILEEGVCLLSNSGVGAYDKFMSVYQIKENQDLSVRKLAEKCGVSKSQVQRFIKLIKE
jgi:AraC-like DNA-binding protein